MMAEKVNDRLLILDEKRRLPQMPGLPSRKESL